MFWNALTDYVWRIVRNLWFLVVEIGFGALGAVKAMTGWPETISAWVWWSALGLSFIGSQFWAYYSLYQEQARLPADHPNLPFAKLADRVLGTVGQDSLAYATRLSTFCADLREAALYGRIQVWGKDISYGNDTDPRVPISNDYWRIGQIDLLATLNDRKGVTEASGHGKYYADLFFDRMQTDLVWPRRLFRRYY